MTKQQLVHTLKTHSVILQGRTALTGTGNKDCLSRFPSFANEPNDIERQKLQLTKVLLQAGLDVVIFGCGSLSAAVPADKYLLGFLL